MTNILLADNDLDFLQTRAEYLEAAGYFVYKASSYEEAVSFLQEADLKRIHIAILDKRLVNDDDEKDESGLKIARELVRTLPKIILTNFPTRDAVREALKTGKDGFSAAVDFLDKNEGPDMMISAVQEALQKISQPNGDLQFRWQEKGVGFGWIAYWIEPNRLENLLEHANALEDAIRMLFRKYDHVTLGRILWKKDKRVILEAFCRAGSREDQFLLTCGDQVAIQQEEQNYQQLAPQGYKNGFLRLALSHQSGRFGALAWEVLPKVNLEDLLTFTMYYRQKSEKNVRQVIQFLFNKTLAEWYSQGCNQNLNRLEKAHYSSGLHAGALHGLFDQLEHAARSLGILRDVKHAADHIVLEFPENGQIRFRSLELFLEANSFPVDDCPLITSLGDLDPDTILVSPDGQAWVTSFSGAGCAPAWRDFVIFEQYVRFGLLNLEHMQILNEFEKDAFSSGPLGSSMKWDAPNPNIAKAWAGIQEIRIQAAKLMGFDPRPYYDGLLENTIHDLRSSDVVSSFTRLEVYGALYRWLFAGHLIEQIIKFEEIDFSGVVDNHDLKPLEFVENNETFRIGNRTLELTPTESKLLLLLYERRNSVVRNEEIVRHFYPETKDLEDQTSWITTTVFRLRQELGDNLYVRNIRKKGYQLVINPLEDKKTNE